ncbi:MAG: hypothetical protein OXN27_24505 [Candidatus Poribacteria bacterium]|nr:hypothetical protein [Candidatus Poribacteria bacterium]
MGWITLTSTVVIAIATVVYVFLTNRLLKETKRSIDETNRPEVVIFLDFEEGGTVPASRALGSYFCQLSLCIMNVGTRTAYKVKFKGDLSFEPALGDPLNQIKSLKDGIPLLIPGQIVSHTISYTDSFTNIFNDEFYKNRSSKVEIHVEYQNVGKKEYKDDGGFTLDFLELNKQQPATKNS